MDSRIAKLRREYALSPTDHSLQMLMKELARAGSINDIENFASAHKAYWTLKKVDTVCQCTFRCEHHIGLGDSIPCKRCGGEGGEQLEDGWMPCYSCGEQGLQINSSGYCLNTITPYTEIRITHRAGPGSGGLETWVPNHLVDEGFDPDAGVPHGYEAETLALAGKQICQTCDTYLQDFGVLLGGGPGGNHADVQYWSPPENPWGEYDEHDPRIGTIVDPGCLCYQCYPHPERKSIIDLYRTGKNAKYHRNPDHDTMRRNPTWHAYLDKFTKKDGKFFFDRRPGYGCWTLKFNLLKDGRITTSDKYGVKVLAQITVTCPRGDEPGKVCTSKPFGYIEPNPWNKLHYDLIREVVDHIPEIGEFPFRDYESINEYLRNAPDGVPLFWYHGTSSSRLPLIQKFGLRPRDQTGSAPVWAGPGRHLPSRTNRVYLTANKNVAKMAAEYACKPEGGNLGGEPVVLTVRIPDPSLLAVDEDSLDATTADYDEKEDFLRRLGEAELHDRYEDSEEWLNYSWKDSLKEVGNIGYLGRIPASHIDSYQQNPEEIKEEFGDCYQAAFDYFMHKVILGESNPSMRLIHATVMGQDEIEGIPHGHAWIEVDVDASKLPPKFPSDLSPTLAIDVSRGRDIQVPALIYRHIGQATDIKSYSWDQAKKLISNYGHYGPWA